MTTDAPFILALDVASTTGVCEGRAGETPRFYTERFGKDGDEHEDAYGRALVWIATRLALGDVDVVYIEAPLGGAAQGHTTADATFRLVGLWAVLAAACKARRVRYSKISVQTARVAFLGRGCGHLKRDEGKRRAFDMCKLLQWSPNNRDEGDAGAVWYLAATREAPRIAQLATPMQQHRVATTIGGVRVDDGDDDHVPMTRIKRGSR